MNTIMHDLVGVEDVSDSTPPSRSGMSEGRWRLDRFERDLSDLKGDVKAGFKEVNVSVSSVGSSIQGLQVSLPLTYLLRVDYAEKSSELERTLKMRFEAQEASCKVREEASSAQIKEMQQTIRSLIFAIIGALITGGLALLAEIFRLLGGKGG